MVHKGERVHQSVPTRHSLVPRLSSRPTPTLEKRPTPSQEGLGPSPAPSWGDHHHRPWSTWGNLGHNTSWRYSMPTVMPHQCKGRNTFNHILWELRTTGQEQTHTMSPCMTVWQLPQGKLTTNWRQSPLLPCTPGQKGLKTVKRIWRTSRTPQWSRKNKDFIRNQFEFALNKAQVKVWI